MPYLLLAPEPLDRLARKLLDRGQELSLRSLWLFSVLLAVATAAAASPRDAARPIERALVLRALPETIRLSGLLVRVDLGESEIAIRDHRAVRRTFAVEGAARETLRSLALGDEVILTCRSDGDARTVVYIEVVHI